jgi:hypothetical protein
VRDVVRRSQRQSKGENSSASIAVQFIMTVLIQKANGKNLKMSIFQKR